MGVAFWCKHLVAIRGAVLQIEGIVRNRLRIATRGTVVEAILCRGSGVGSWIVRVQA
jgi:hypothetical protein